MKEHEDDVLPGVKESTATVDSTTADENVIERGKIEGVLGKKDEGEDMMVDVVGADDHGGNRVDLDSKASSNGLVEECSKRETETPDQAKEDVAIAEEVTDALVERRVLTSEKVEVAVSEGGVKSSVEVGKEVLEENVLTTVASGSDCDAQKSGNMTMVGDFKKASGLLSEEPQAGGREIAARDNKVTSMKEQPTESVQEVAGETEKKSEVVNSSETPESFNTTANHGSPEGAAVAGEEGLVGKDKGEDGVNNQSLLTEVVDAGTDEGSAHVSKENVDQQAGVDQMRKESSLLTNEVTTNDAQKSGNETPVGDAKIVVSLSGDPQLVGGESLIREAESGRGLIEEKVQQPVESSQEVADVDRVRNANTGKDEVLDSTKSTESETKVDGVVVEEDLVARDGVLKATSLVGPDNPSLSIDGGNAGTGEDAVHVNAGKRDQKAEVECQMIKEESSHSTKEVSTDNVQKSGKGTGVGDSNTEDATTNRDSECIKGEIAVMDDEVELERVSVKEIVEQPMSSVQEVADGGRVMDEKIGKQDEVLDSSEIPESSTKASLCSEDVDVVIVEEGSEGKDEALDGVSVEPSLVNPDHQSFSAEGVNAGTSEGASFIKTEGSKLKNEVDPTGKDDSSRAIDLITTDASHRSSKVSEDSGCTEQVSVKSEDLRIDNKVCDSGKNMDVAVEGLKFQAVDKRSKTEVAACSKVDEVIAAQNEPNSMVQASTVDGIVLENQSLKVKTLADSSKPNLVACTEPESSIKKMVPATTEKVVEIDRGVQTSKVEPPTIGDSSNYQEDQGLKAEAMSKSLENANPSDGQLLLGGNGITAVPDSNVEVSSIGEMNGSQTSAEAFDKVNHATTHADYVEHGVLPVGSEFSYEEAHMERGEDAGMDIDEVLGWKDEIPGIDALNGDIGCQEKDQHFEVNANSEADVEGGLPKPSCEPVLTGQEEEDLSSQQPRVYERRVHAEGLHDAQDGSCPPQVKHEKLTVETQCGNSKEDNRFVQKEEQKVETTSLSGVDEKVKEDVEKHSGTMEQTDFCRDQETLEHTSEAEQSTCMDDVTEPHKDGTSVSLQQLCYFHPPENEGEFSVSDLVWGKVRSHPWWPGQIFDPSDASDKAMKYHKKDCFLVAYFGDRTFAWNDSSVLKPFRAKFSQIEKHSNSEAFRNAVHCALEEVSRRVELGLACACVSQDIYEKIECQVVENAGIRQESSRRHGIDKSASVSSFEPDKLVDYVRLLAMFPYDGDAMELAMAKAQLSTYGRYKGHRELPEFLFCGNLVEDASMLSEGVEEVNKDSLQTSDKDIVGGYSARASKEKSLSVLTEDATYSGDGVDGNITSPLVTSPGSKKRKALDSISDGSDKRPSLHPETIPTALTPTAKPSFKVGECIQRVASQLTGPPSVPKSGGDKTVEPADQPVGLASSVQSPGPLQHGRTSNQASLDEMLSQLHLAAQDPMKGHSFLNTIIPFFHSHKASVLIKSLRQISSTGRPSDARKRKPSNENDPEEFEFDDVNDSYWTDRIIQNYPEEQQLPDNQNGGGEQQVVAFEQDKPVKPSRRSNKKRFFSSNHEIEAKEQSELIERRRQNLATEVLMKFPEGIYFPSEIHLNKMFRRFGPLMESETEVDRHNCRARVVFKKCSDAEVAHSSAGKFNIFGSIAVTYELNYTPLISYKPLPLPLAQDPTDAC